MIMNNYNEKNVKINPDKNISTEVIENEGIVIADEQGDKIYFINATGLILFQEIKDDKIENVFQRYRTRIEEVYDFHEQEIIKKSFYDFLNIMIDNDLAILFD